MVIDSMKRFWQIMACVCLMATYRGNAAEQPDVKDTGPATERAAVGLRLLQGVWEGVLVGDAAHQKITITIADRSLHFHRDTNFWFKTTFTLPAGKNPMQLHATIKDCPPSADSVGKVVKAFFKIEDGTLTLATMGDDTEETPQSFEAAGTRYELRKVQRPGKNPLVPKTDGLELPQKNPQ